MAIKASASITVSSVVDVAAVYRYYLLQSSTLAKPAVPTTNPPGGSWVLAEPAYTSGSTNSLYFTDLTVFSDGTFAYSSVSLSSSYEAAKAAWNKAQTAQSSADAAQSTANAARADFQRVVRIDTNGLHIGDNQTTHELLLTSDSLNVIVDGIIYSRFAARYAQFGAYQIREDHNGGLVFKLGDPLYDEPVDGPQAEGGT